MRNLLDLRFDGSEKVKYDYDDFRSYIRDSMLSVWPNYTAFSHWHDDLEFISILSGYMDYNVNGEIIRLNAGQGIMVNSRQLHYGFSREQKECKFICILLHPVILCSSQHIERDFVSPILSDDSIPYILLDEKVDWQRQILDDLKHMCDSKEKTTAPLLIQSLFSHIWFLISENALNVKHTKRLDRNLSVFKDMLIFVQKNYGDKITLEDIAKSGNVSKSTCLVIFKKYLQDTPTNYLIGYRLKKALKMLNESYLSITEIALEVGFSGVSYFAETFKKNYGCSPSEYRKSKKFDFGSK